ncbi:hypothetical protein OSTOST_13614 [Ostertagia ostertagi]
MKLDSVLTMVGDFAAMKRTPDYKPVTQALETRVTKEPAEEHNSQRRHSLHISVGTEEVPRLTRPRSESFCSSSPPVESKLYEKSTRRVSAPCLSTSGSSTALRKKLQKLRGQKSIEKDEHALKEQSESEDDSPRQQASPLIMISVLNCHFIC